MEISNMIKYVGVNDHDIDLFEGQYIVENGSWAPIAVKTMKALLEPCKNLTYIENEVQIKSALNEESISQLDALATELTKEWHI